MANPENNKIWLGDFSRVRKSRTGRENLTRRVLPRQGPAR